MIARMTTCRDLTDNEADAKKIGELFMTLQTNTTPVSLLFPWFPSPARKTTKQASTDMYTILYTHVETRRHAEPTSDAIDVLISDGETTQNIVGVSPGLGVRHIPNSDSTFGVHYVGTLLRRHLHHYDLYVSVTGMIDEN